MTARAWTARRAQRRADDARQHRHGLRASEVVGLRWDDFDLTRGRVHVRRSKGGETAVHPIGGKEIRALRRLQRESDIRSGTRGGASLPLLHLLLLER